MLTNGDTLVSRLDCLGRSLRDLADIANEMEKAGVNLRVIEADVGLNPPAPASTSCCSSVPSPAEFRPRTTSHNNRSAA